MECRLQLVHDKMNMNVKDEIGECNKIEVEKQQGGITTNYNNDKVEKVH